ncbi:MAG TPA: hypothetical protein VN253_06880 [Kofleriaceae bacterium]|nr:hypothetical protein [Kofleriaceae bacterium]
MKPGNPDQNQGEGDRESARRYNRHLRTFIARGKVEGAAREAEDYVEHHPAEAASAEKQAKRGPRGRRVSVDELVAKGCSMIERVRPAFARLAARIRNRLHLK